MSILDVLRVGLVEIAVFLLFGKDGNISPGSSGPIWVVVSLFWAFETMFVSIVVLSGEEGRSSSIIKSTFLLSVGDEETHVSVSGLAFLIVVIGLMHTVEELFISILSVKSSWVVWNGICGSTVSDSLGVGVSRSTAHVLDNHIALHSWILATMLNGPLNSKLRAFIESHSRSITVASLSVILRIKESVSIVSVCVCLVKTVIATSRILHIAIRVDGASK